MGRPNVGKSSLFNRLNNERVAITHHVSGSTRDINKRRVTLGSCCVVLVDTGGLDLSQNSDLLSVAVSEKSCSVLKECDVIIYMLDGQQPLDQSDVKMYRELCKKRPTLLVLNKVDNPALELQAMTEFAVFGDNYICVCVSHNRGISELIELVERKVLQLQRRGLLHVFKPQNDGVRINVGIIGRPNVGKSSLLNALVGRQRSLVSDVAGTTMDPVDEVIEHSGFVLNFIDTAGIRRRGKIQGVEKYALQRTRDLISRCDIAIVVLDSSCEFSDLDEKICGEAAQHHLGMIIVLHKWDIRLHEFQEYEIKFKKRFKFMKHVPLMVVSSHMQKNIVSLKDKILQVYENFSFRIPTSKLNDVISEFVMQHPLPSDRGKLLKIYYATQVSACPPHIILRMNRPDALHFSYKRYLINNIRQRFNLFGTGIIIEAKSKQV